MEVFDEIFFFPEFDSNEESFLNNNSSNSSPNQIEQSSSTEYNIPELMLPIETNYNLASSNFFQDDFKIKQEIPEIPEINQETKYLSIFDQQIMPQKKVIQIKDSPPLVLNEIQKDNSQNQEAQKKKRGRPKKVKENDNVPKKRGRPKTKKESEDDTYTEEISFEKKNKSKEITFEKGKSCLPEIIEIPPLGNAFIFQRDQLLSMTSNDIERYYEAIKKHRDLNEEEENRYKKHNRLIRNRESAQKSRKKKRMYVDKLENKITQLENQINLLKEQNNSYLNDIHLLKERNNYLENQIKKNDLENSKFDVKKGVFLFVFIFSFGFFLNYNLFPQKPFIHNLPQVPHSVPFSHNRGLLSTSPSKTLTLPSPKSSDTPNNQRTKINIVNKNSNSVIPNTKDSNFLTNKKNAKDLVISHDALVNEHSKGELDPDLVDDASYIYCSEAKRVSKGSSKSPVIGFLIPSEFLNDTNLIPRDRKSVV